MIITTLMLLLNMLLREGSQEYQQAKLETGIIIWLHLLP